MPFAFVGNAGQAILFVITLAFWALASIYLIIHSCHHYLVVVQGTAAGIDEVKWPDEPIADWLVQAVSLSGLLAIWLVPVGFLARALGSIWMTDDPVGRVFLLALPVLWLFFPLSLLSSMGSTSRWQILNGRILLGLCKLLPSMLTFYLITAAVFAVGGFLAYLGLFATMWYVLPLAAIVNSALLLIHARMVGRLGWLLQQLRKPRGNRVKKNRPLKKKSRAAAVNDPWSSRDVEQIPIPREVEAPEEKPVEPKQPRPSYLDPEPEPYTLAEIGALETATCAPRLELNQEQVDYEIELRTRKPPNPPPDYPLFSGVWTFPFYSNTTKAWVELTLITVVAGMAFRTMIDLFPGK